LSRCPVNISNFFLPTWKGDRALESCPVPSLIPLLDELTKGLNVGIVHRAYHASQVVPELTISHKATTMEKRGFVVHEINVNLTDMELWKHRLAIHQAVAEYLVPLLEQESRGFEVRGVNWHREEMRMTLIWARAIGEFEEEPA